MKWRTLAVAMVGVSATLASCSFDDAWRDYCGYPGRCSKLHDGGVTLIAQSTTRRLVLTGDYLFGASSVTVVPAVGTASIISSDDGHVVVDVTLDPGVAVGTQLKLRVGWERPEDGFQDSPPLEVTPIWVMEGRDDDGGFGTPDAPYGTLRYASQVSGYGDTIRLGPGRFHGIAPGGACDLGAGLKPGVKVQGESLDASVIEGPGQCGFNLFEGAQEVRQLTVFGFGEGIRASDAGAGGGGRPTVSDVSVTGCDAGVAALPGSWLQLDRVDLVANGFGLKSFGADVVMQDGGISQSSGNGVWMAGDLGRLVLDRVDTSQNALAGSGDLGGAGILLQADGGKVTLGPGTQSTTNGSTSVTIAGRGNEVTLDGVTLDDTIALLVMGNESAVSLRNITFSSDGKCIEVRSFQVFNAGTGDGGYGGGSLSCANTVNDTRASGPSLDFAGVIFGAGVPPAGIVNSSSGNTYGITFAGSTEVHFH